MDGMAETPSGVTLTSDFIILFLAVLTLVIAILMVNLSVMPATNLTERREVAPDVASGRGARRRHRAKTATRRGEIIPEAPEEAPEVVPEEIPEEADVAEKTSRGMIVPEVSHDGIVSGAGLPTTAEIVASMRAEVQNGNTRKAQEIFNALMPRQELVSGSRGEEPREIMTRRQAEKIRAREEINEMLRESSDSLEESIAREDLLHQLVDQSSMSPELREACQELIDELREVRPSVHLAEAQDALIKDLATEVDDVAVAYPSGSESAEAAQKRHTRAAAREASRRIAEALVSE
jgi:hypothetical protein